VFSHSPVCPSDRPAQVMRGMSAAERAAILKFATSTSRPPLGGFKHLNPPLVIHKAWRSSAHVVCLSS
jgi:HECT-domain (ubiquitin-transferase)